MHKSLARGSIKKSVYTVNPLYFTLIAMAEMISIKTASLI